MDVFDTDFLLVKVDFDQAYLHGDYMSEIGKLIQDSEGKFAILVLWKHFCPMRVCIFTSIT